VTELAELEAPVPARYKLTVDDFHRLGEAGTLTEHDRVELIEGELIEMSPVGDAHVASVLRLTTRFARLASTSALISVQNPIRLGTHSEPQPDLALLRPRDDFYATGKPGAADILLLVEVADSSVGYDRGTKIPLYARHGIPEIWLVDLPGNRIEIFRQPRPQGYRQKHIARVGDALSPEALPDVKLTVAELLAEPQRGSGGRGA
jgi:Uma2 family endonuclease